MSKLDELLSRLHRAIRSLGAPGDHGYNTPQGQKLLELHRAEFDLVTHLRERSAG